VYSKSVCPLSFCQLSSHSFICRAMLHSLCCAMLRCAVLCCAVLCCAVLCCAVLCCAVLCCAVLCRAASEMVSHAVSWMLAKPGCMHKDVCCIVHKYSVCSQSASALLRQDSSCTYLAHHELDSVIIIIIGTIIVQPMCLTQADWCNVSNARTAKSLI